jgi:3-methyladenine DNA glycosylase/8-oxoguanine DNA glycosylase
MRLFLPVKAPFSLTAVIRSHGWVQLAPFATNGDYQHLTTVDQLTSGRVVPLSIEAGDDVEITVPNVLSQSEQAEVTGKVAWMLGLDRDLSGFYAVARSEPKLQAMIAGKQGRILRSPTLFEDTVKTILTTNTSWSGTIRMVRSLVEQYGSPLPEDAGQRAFPTPSALAQADVETLRQEAKLGYRAPYVLELAQQVAAGDLDLEGLKTAVLPTPELRQELLQIKGVGSYAAANLLMLIGRTDFIPIDSYAMKMVSHEFHGGQPIGPAEVEAAFADWGEWKGMAFWFWDWSYQD